MAWRSQQTETAAEMAKAAKSESGQEHGAANEKKMAIAASLWAKESEERKLKISKSMKTANSKNWRRDEMARR